MSQTGLTFRRYNHLFHASKVFIISFALFLFCSQNAFADEANNIAQIPGVNKRMTISAGPSAAHGEVAASAVGYASAWRVFNGMSARLDKLSEIESGQINLEGYETDNGKLWFSGSGDFSDIKLDNVDKVKSNSYSGIAGADTNGFFSAGGQEYTSIFVGYLRNDSEFEGLKQSSDGVIGGISEFWTLNGGFLGLTVVGGYSTVTPKGAGKFSLLYAGGSLKGGYSFRFGDVFTLRPQAQVSYTYASTEKYIANGAEIEKATSGGVNVRPSIYMAFTLPAFWSIYLEAGYAYTNILSGKISTTLESVNYSGIGAYAEGSFGIEKVWANGIGLHLQVNGAMGGVNGFGADIGIKSKF